MKATGELTCTMAIAAEIAMKTTISERMIPSCFFSLISRLMISLIKSMVRVERDAMTKDDKVDIDADYYGFTVGNQFIVGYGLDYNQSYRQLPYITVLTSE